jgi:hypothetical protein
MAIPATAAADLDAAAVRHDVAGHQHDEHAIGDVMQLEAIRIADHQDEPDHDPKQRRGHRLGEAPVEHGQHRAAEEHQDQNLVGQRAEIAGRERADRALAVLRQDDENGDQQADQQKQQDAIAHGD